MNPALREDYLQSNSTSTSNNFNFSFAYTELDNNYINLDTYLYDLNSPQYKLKEKLLVKITEEDDCFRAENASFGIWATGEDVSEAVSSLKEEVIELYLELKEAGESNLGSEPTKWWKRFSRLIIENEEA
jgi:predicted RNase H-like HicB family nuclease